MTKTISSVIISGCCACAAVLGIWTADGAGAAPLTPITTFETTAFIDCGWCYNSAQGVEKHSFGAELSHDPGTMECNCHGSCHASGYAGFCDDCHDECPVVAPTPAANASVARQELSLDDLEGAARSGDSGLLQGFFDLNRSRLVVNRHRSALQVTSTCGTGVIASFAIPFDLLEKLGNS